MLIDKLGGKPKFQANNAPNDFMRNSRSQAEVLYNQAKSRDLRSGLYDTQQ